METTEQALEQVFLAQELQRQQKNKTLEAFFDIWWKHIRENIPYIKQSLAEIPIKKHETVYIFAPGASLSQYENRIHMLQSHGLIIGTPTVLHWMYAHDIIPDIVVAVDSSEEMEEQIAASGYDGPIIAPVTVCNGIAKRDTYFMVIIMDHVQKIGDKIQPANDIDACMLSMFRELLFFLSLGHVTAAALQTLVTLAMHRCWTPQRFVLVGADYGYWRGYGRVSKTGDAMPKQPDEKITIGGIDTDYKMAIYKARLYQYWAAVTPNLYTLSDGLLHEIPHMSFDDLLQNRFPQPLGKEAAQEAYRKYVMETFPQEVLPQIPRE